MLWSVSPSIQNPPPGFICLNNNSAQYTECVQFPPAQTQKCCRGLTLTCSGTERLLPSPLPCRHSPCPLLHMFCLFGHIFYLQTHFLLVPLASSSSECEHTLLCFFHAFHMWLYVCISLGIASFLLHWKAANIPISSGTQKQLWLHPCKFGDKSWHIHFWSQLLWAACLSL